MSAYFFIIAAVLLVATWAISAFVPGKNVLAAQPVRVATRGQRRVRR